MYQGRIVRILSASHRILAFSQEVKKYEWSDNWIPVCSQKMHSNQKDTVMYAKHHLNLLFDFQIKEISVVDNVWEWYKPRNKSKRKK
jgi:hypothetical protein